MQLVVDAVLCMRSIHQSTMYNSEPFPRLKLSQTVCMIPQVHEYLRSKLCSLYENDCIFDKFECVWNSSDR